MLPASTRPRRSDYRSFSHGHATRSDRNSFTRTCEREIDGGARLDENFARPFFSCRPFSTRKRERNEETLDANGERSNAVGKISSEKILAAGCVCIETSNQGCSAAFFLSIFASLFLCLSLSLSLSFFLFLLFPFSPSACSHWKLPGKIDTERCESSRERVKANASNRSRVYFPNFQPRSFPVFL